MPITRATITDDDGSGTTGDIADAAFMTAFYDAIDVAINAAWVTPTFNAAHFSGGAGTWTVAAGDVQAMAWRRLGNTVTCAWVLNTTTVGGSTNTLLIGNGQWGGAVSAKTLYTPLAWLVNGGAAIPGYAYVHPGVSAIGLVRADTANYATGADATYVYGNITFEVTP